jgi:hypothetical protein
VTSSANNELICTVITAHNLPFLFSTEASINGGYVISDAIDSAAAHLAGGDGLLQADHGCCYKSDVVVDYISLW